MSSKSIYSIVRPFVRQNHWSFVVINLRHAIFNKALSSLLGWSLLGLELHYLYLTLAMATHECIVTFFLFLLARAF